MTKPTESGEADNRSAGESRIVYVDLVVTAVHAMASLLALSDSDALLTIAVVVNLVMFLAGTVVFFVAFAVAANRSRIEDVWFGAVFFLSGTDTAAAGARRLLRGCVLVQTVVGLAVAATRPFTAAAFAVLGSLLGWGLMALYGALFGRFHERQEAG